MTCALVVDIHSNVVSTVEYIREYAADKFQCVIDRINNNELMSFSIDSIRI